MDIAIDKLKHSFVGILLCFAFYVTEVLHVNHIWAYLFCLVIAATREIEQKITKKGTPELLDFLYTIIAPTIFYIFTFL